MVPPRPHRLAVLVGNGLSIAFNSELSTAKINADIIDRLNRAGDEGTLPAKIMQQVARNIGAREGGDPAENFEALLGPLDQYRDATRMLRELQSLAGQHSTFVANALDIGAQFADGLRRIGVGHVLEVIAQRSKAHYHLTGGLQNFIEHVVGVAAGGSVAFGNLNYDSLLMAVLCDLFGSELCDMTDGRVLPSNFAVVPDTPLPIAGRPLRTTTDFPFNRQIRLLHLHGSLTWLREPGPEGRIYRFDIDGLRLLEYWRAWREGRSPWSPEVVLTNQAVKSTAVGNYPFSLAYSAFYDRLLTADKWLIAGYSFGDECVNELLARAWEQRQSVPQVLVVTMGDAPTEQQVIEAVKYNAVLRGDPHPEGWLHIHRGGVGDAAESWPWAEWAGQTAVEIGRAG